MSNIATYLEGLVQDWGFAGTDMPTAPGTVYLALHSADPGNDGSANELTASDYDRISTGTADWTQVSSPNPTTIENANQLTFGEATSDWGTVSHVSIWDASSSGNCLWQGALDTSKTVNTGDELIFRANDIHIELS